MTLSDVFNQYTIRNVTDDTAKVTEGSLFIAIEGRNFDGHSVAKDMLTDKKAAAVVVERDLGIERQIIVENTRKAFAEAASVFYGNPTSKLKLLAVTGTNGKSTTASFIKRILEKNGHKTGFIGTTCYDVCNPDGSVEHSRSHLSTPRQDKLYSLFAGMVDNNAEYCVMEASSQALDQYRIYGEVFEVGVFTNLTQDHLDWHKTMENYYSAKKMLFGMTKRAVVCVDDKYGARLANEIRDTIPTETFSIDGISDNTDYYAVNVKTASSGVSYWLSDVKSEKSFPVKFGMPGMFNVANSIGAVAACKAAGVGINSCVDAVQGFNGVRGRCEVIYDGDFTVICDYAHTGDALAKILLCVKQFVKYRIICVFGAAGERDADKRPAMGAVVAKYADFIVITSDNPRFEDQQQIIEQVKSGLPKNAPPCETFIDREEAIKFALEEAGAGDVVLLCGKGHETEQVIGDEEQPFDEREIVKRYVKSV